MCRFLSKTRRLIGRHTKFKISPWIELGKNTVFFWALVSFITVSTIFPAVSSTRTLPVDSDVHLSNWIRSAESQSKDIASIAKLFSRFIGRTETTSSPGRPGHATIKDLYLPDDVSSQPAMRNILKEFSERYMRTASELHLRHTDRGEDDLAFEESRNNTGNGTYHSRSKRDVIFADNTFSVQRTRRKTLSHEREGTFVINSVGRTSPQYYDNINAIDINWHQAPNKNYLISIEDVGDLRKLMMNVLDGNNLKQRLLFQTNAPDAVSIETFKIKEDLFAFTTVKHDPTGTLSTDTINTGSTLYRINIANNTFDKTQTIHLPFAQSSAFWSGMGEEANDIFLAIAPAKSLTETGTSYAVTVPCYRWQGGYFDYVSKLPASNPQSINHFAMFSHDYLAVANYQDDTGTTSIRSEIFKYQHSEAKFVSFQKIQTFGAKDIRHFTFESPDGRRKENFIAIANSCKIDENGKPQFRVQSTIMKFGELRFMPFKSFYAFGATQFLPVKHDNKFFLALADFHGIRMFQYNGWTFVQTHSMQFDSEKASPFSINLRQLSIDDQSFIAVASKSKGVKNGIFSVGFETRNDHRKLVTSVETWCESANEQIQSRSLSDIENEISSAPKVTDEQVVVHGTITFEKGVKVDELNSRALRMGRSKVLDDEEFKLMSANERRFITLSQRLGMVHDRMGHVVWTDRDQVVEGNILFRNVQYNNPILQVINLQVDTLSSVRVADHLENLIFLDRQQALQTIQTESLQTTDLETSTVNSRSLADYALKNPQSTQVFTGTNEFLSNVLITDGITVTNEFAGLSFSHPTFLLSEGNQTFPGLTMQLSKTIVENLYTRNLNDNDVFFYYLDALPLSGGSVKAKKSFKSLTIQSAQTRSVNNVNVDVLYENAIYTDARAPQSFTGATYIESMEINELNPVNPAINEEFELSGDFINIEKGKYKIKSLRVTQGTDIQDLFVSRQLNNIQVFDTKLDVLFSNSIEPQLIQIKKLRSLSFENDVEAKELVDGIQLSTWSELQEIQLDGDAIEGLLTVKGSIQCTDNLIVGKSFQQGDSDVLSTLQKIASTDDVMLPGSCDLQFENLAIDGNSDIRGHISGVQPSEWVVNSDLFEVTVTGEKTFTEVVHLSKNVGAQALFGSKQEENLFEVLLTVLLDGVNQTLTQPLVFTSPIQVGKASCPNAIINEIPFENILFKKGDQTIHVESIFRNSLLAKEGSSVKGNMNADVINGIKFKDQLQDTLRTGKDVGTQIVSAKYSFSELITKQTTVEESFASTDAKSIFQNIVLKNQPGIVKLNANQMVFNKPATLGLLDFVGRLNGMPSSDWGNAWMLTHGDQLVNTKLAFEGPLTANRIEAPSIKGLDIQQLSSEIVRIDADEFPQGTFTFTNIVQANSGIVTADDVKVNGIDLRRDVLLKSSPEMQVIEGDKNFMDGMTIKGNLFVKEMSNFDISNFANLLNVDENAIKDTEESLIVNGNLKLEQEPGFQSTFNGQNWNDITDQFWLRDRDVHLHQPVQFSSLVLTKGGSMDAAATLNGQDLPTFEKSYASKTRDQEWTGNVILQNVEQIHTLKAESLSTESKTFNGINLLDFYQSVLTYSGDQVIHGTFKANNLDTVRFDTASGATLNSQELRDFMMLSVTNEVTAPKKVDTLVVNTIHLTKDTVIDGVEMGKWEDQAVKLKGNQDVKGPIQVGDLETTETVVVDGLVDGIKYNVDNIFTTDMDQEIFGNVVIIQDDSKPTVAALTAPAGLIVEGNLNGFDVKDSMKKMVFKNVKEDTPIVIKTPTEFDAPVILSQVRTEALVQGHNVADTIERFSRTQEQLSSNNFKARERYEELLTVANRMLRVSDNRAVFLDHFVLTQTIQVAATYVQVLRKVGYPAIAIGFKKGPSLTTENWWSYSAVVDYYQLQIGNRVQLEGIVSDIAELQTGEEHLFAFAVNSDQNDRPASTSLEVIGSVKDFEINKSPGKRSKAFILKSVDIGTPNVRPAISQIIYSNGFKSLRSFSVLTGGSFTDCIVATTNTVANAESPVRLFCLDSDGTLNAVQEINLDSPTLTTSVTNSKGTILGIMTKSRIGQFEGLLEFWGNSADNTALTFSKQNCLPVFNAVSLDSIATDDDMTFLVVASGALRRSGYPGSVFVYRYSETTHEFKKMQTIEVSHPKDVKLQWTKPSNELLMYILTESVTDNINVYKYQGLSGWNRVHQFTSENGDSIQVTDFTVDGVYRAQLLVTSATETNIYSAEFMGITTVVEETMETMRQESSVIRQRIDFDNL